jgi:hypothetical protein
MVTFVPNSTFGRKTLRNVFESEATRVSAWLLNVPSDTVGDRKTWTWAENWKNYRVQSPLAYTTNVSVIDLESQSTTRPSSIQLLEEGVHVSPGAYYDEGIGSSTNNQYTYVYNTGTQTITFTHYAVFVQEQASSSLTYYATDVTSLRTNNYLALVKPYDVSEDPVTLGPGQVIYLDFNFLAPAAVGASCSNFDSYSSLVAADEAFVNDFIDETNLYSPPSLFASVPFNSYSLNRSTSPFLLQAYKNLLGFTPSTSAAPRFLAELLNVTDTEPAFDAPWSTWSTSSINRFALASPDYQYDYSEESGFFTVVVPDEGEFKLSLASDKVRLKDNVEFVVTPPASSSFTYTHLAIFLQPDAALPANGQPYTHTDPDTFVGVIRLAASVTMTSTSTARAYPFNLGLVYNPELTVEEI